MDHLVIYAGIFGDVAEAGDREIRQSGLSIREQADAWRSSRRHEVGEAVCAECLDDRHVTLVDADWNIAVEASVGRGTLVGLLRGCETKHQRLARQCGGICIRLT